VLNAGNIAVTVISDSAGKTRQGLSVMNAKRNSALFLVSVNRDEEKRKVASLELN
jgi:hypothetical protein